MNEFLCFNKKSQTCKKMCILHRVFNPHWMSIAFMLCSVSYACFHGLEHMLNLAWVMRNPKSGWLIEYFEGGAPIKAHMPLSPFELVIVGLVSPCLTCRAHTSVSSPSIVQAMVYFNFLVE